LLIELNFSNLFIASNLGTRSTFRSKKEREFFDCLKKKGEEKIGKKRNPHFLPSKHATTHHSLLLLSLLFSYHHYYSTAITLRVKR